MKVDGRTLGHESLETLRKMAVQRVRDGEKPSVVIASMGMCRTSIYRWLRAAKRGGEKALAAQKPTGRPRALTAEQARKVRTWINGRDPRQYGFDFGLWTRQLVAKLIETRIGVRLGVTAVGRLLATLGITPQKPLRRAYERDSLAIERWKTEEYPAIRARAAKRDADVFFLDEAGVRSDAPPGKTWGIRGETPVVRTSGQRQSINAISAVSPRGAFWYATFSGRFNAGRFRDFLRNFMKGRRRPVILVMDGHPAHKAKIVREYADSTKGKLELQFLPGYAPELNPDELVWRQVKHHGISKRPLMRGESLRRRVDADLAAIRANRRLVLAFFREPSVAYITD